MTPANWIALIGVGLTVLGLIVQASLFAFFLGKMSSRANSMDDRLKHLESQPVYDCKSEMAAVNATLTAFKETFERMDRTFTDRFVTLEHTVRNYLMKGN